MLDHARFGIVTALAMGAILVPATPATAVEGDRGRFNMWQHDSYEGQVEVRRHHDKDLHNDSCSGCDPGPGGNFGDDMSSFVNRSRYWVLISTNAGFNGDTFCVRPFSHDADLGNNGFSDLEDEISSIDVLAAEGSSAPTASCSRDDDLVLGHAN